MRRVRRQIEAALAPGVRDAKLLRHAGVIALKGGDRAAAELYPRQSAELNAAGSEQARSLLNTLVPNTAGR